VQGIGVATGLQNKFDWAGVAAIGVSGAVGGQFGQKAQARFGTTGTRILAGTAAAITNAATRSAIIGDSFGDSLKQALPTIIGQIAGQALGDAANGAFAKARAASTAVAGRPVEKQSATNTSGEITAAVLSLPEVQPVIGAYDMIGPVASLGTG